MNSYTDQYECQSVKMKGTEANQRSQQQTIKTESNSGIAS